MTQLLSIPPFFSITNHNDIHCLQGFDFTILFSKRSEISFSIYIPCAMESDMDAIMIIMLLMILTHITLSLGQDRGQEDVEILRSIIVKLLLQVGSPCLLHQQVVVFLLILATPQQ